MLMKLINIFFVLQVLLPPFNSIPTEDSSTTEDEDYVDDISGMVFIDLALEGGAGCDDRKLYMERYIGLSPKLENYYNASIYLDHHLREDDMYLRIEFASAANIMIEQSAARVDHLEGNVYLMTIPGQSKYITFTVRAAPDKPFPAIILLELDGKPLCNLIKWSPSILGPSAKAVSHSVLPPSADIPYCGRKKVVHTALVTKGELTKEGDWPWHAALYKSDENGTVWKYLCGVTVLSKTALITAAHCVVIENRLLEASRFKVVVGKYSMDDTMDQYAVEIGVKEIVIHDEFGAKNLKNDIAILKVNKDIDYTDYVQPVCLWEPKHVSKEALYGEFGTVIGWGVKEHDKLSEKLTVGAMRVVPDSVCIRSLPSFFSRFLNSQSFCAGNGPNNGTSACNGDNGGGFVFPVKQADGLNTWYLRGVVSLSVRRADSDMCDPKHYILLTASLLGLRRKLRFLSKSLRKRCLFQISLCFFMHNFLLFQK